MRVGVHARMTHPEPETILLKLPRSKNGSIYQEFTIERLVQPKHRTHGTHDCSWCGFFCKHRFRIGVAQSKEKREWYDDFRFYNGDV